MSAGQDQETIHALSQAVGTSEAGRRVGWARAYAAEASKDDLSRDLNMMRSERDIMLRAASFLYGFFRSYLELRGDGGLATQALSRWSEQVQSVLDPQVARAGREVAERIAEADPEWAADRAARAEFREAARAARKKQSNADGRQFKAGRDKARELLAKQYGFPNVAAMLNYLGDYGRRR